MVTDSTAIFYNRPEDALGVGVIVSIVLAIVALRWRRLLAAMGRNRLIILIVALGLFGPGLIGFYVLRGGRQAQEIVLNSSGIWCRNWNLRLDWREISFVDEIDTTGNVGKRVHGRWATFDLTPAGLANHPWNNVVRLAGKASCSIDDLDQPYDDVYRTIRRFYDARP
jgi:Na+/melibiose symporter-like transporter